MPCRSVLPGPLSGYDLEAGLRVHPVEGNGVSGCGSQDHTFEKRSCHKDCRGKAVLWEAGFCCGLGPCEELDETGKKK